MDTSLVISFGASAQNDVDSLQAKYDSVTNPLQRAELAIQLADRFVYGRPKRSEALATEAFRIADSLNNNLLRASALNRMGTANWSMGNLSQALNLLNRSVDISKTYGYENILARNLGYLGNVYSMAGDKISSIEYYHKALVKHLKLNNQIRIFTMNNNIGKSYLDNVQFDSASKYLQLANARFDESFGRMKPILLFNLANLQFLFKNYDKADSILNICVIEGSMYKDYRAISRSNQLKAEIYLVNRNFDRAKV